MITTEFFAETGTEGFEYCLYDHSKSGYSGLISLSDGDQLLIYSPEWNLSWCGIIKKDYQTNRIIYPYYFNLFKKDPEYLRSELLFASSCRPDDRRSYCKEVEQMNYLELEQYLIKFHSQQLVEGCWVHWTQNNVDPAYWQHLFLSNFRVEYIPA